MFRDPRPGRSPTCRCPGSRAAYRTSGAGSSRVRGAPEVLGQVPVSCLAEEIATPGDGPDPRAVHDRRQPGAVGARAAKLDAALPALDCMISVDNWLNETTRHAHVILPGLSPLEQPHYDELHLAASRCAARPSTRAPIFPPADGRPHEWEILHPPRRRLPRAAGRRGRRRRASTTGSSTCSPIGRRGSTAPAPARAGYDDGRARAAARLHDPHRPVGRPLRRGPRRAHARQARRPSRTASTSGPIVPRLDEVLHDAGGQGRARAAVHHRRPPAAGGAARPAGRRRSCWSAAATCARTTRGCTTCRCW